MTRLPWDPAELGRDDSELDAVAYQLQRHASNTAASPSPDLTARIVAALDDEPLPRAAWWKRLGRGAGMGTTLRLMATATVLVLGVVGGLAVGSLADLAQRGAGSSSSPALAPTVSPSPSPTPSPTLTPLVSPSPSSSPSPVSSARLTTPEPTEDEIETPEPGESQDDDDNSGSGGGGNSGSGGGGDDNSGSGGGGNSGPGGGDDR